MLKRNTTSKKVTSKGVLKTSAVITAGKAVFRSDARQTASLVKAGRNGAAKGFPGIRLTHYLPAKWNAIQGIF